MSSKDLLESSPRPAAPAEVKTWLERWFPVAFLRDLDLTRPTRVTVHGIGYVLFRDEVGAWSALLDRCAHRGARLSDGCVTGGEVECLYHGWRFGGDGRCTEAPQLPSGSPMPERAHAKRVPLRVDQGVAWIWCGEGAPNEDPPTVPGIDAAGVHSIDFTMDLPYGQDYFIENVLDIAHIHVAHDGSRGGGSRSFAAPLEFRVGEVDAAGFEATFRTLEREAQLEASPLRAAHVRFRSPNLVHYLSEYADGDPRISGLALYSIPLDVGRCRMLYRAYGNTWSKEDLSRPRWLEHQFQCHLLEEDMAIVRGQAEEIDGGDEPLARSWLPLKSSDGLVLAYRRWIDDHAKDRPGAVGLRDVGERGVLERDVRCDRWWLHTRHCADCRAALERFERGRRLLPYASYGALAVAALAPLGPAVAAALLGVTLQLAAAHCRKRVCDLTVNPRDPRPNPNE